MRGAFFIVVVLLAAGVVAVLPSASAACTPDALYCVKPGVTHCNESFCTQFCVITILNPPIRDTYVYHAECVPTGTDEKVQHATTVVLYDLFGMQE
jgi:hypothetical protein